MSSSWAGGFDAAAKVAEARARLLEKADLIQAAYHYADMGLRVFSLRQKEPALWFKAVRYERVPDRDKFRKVETRVGSWTFYRDHLTTEPDIVAMFGPDAVRGVDGLGALLGRGSGGLFVRDFDDPRGYARWAAANPKLASRCPTARTGRGFHVYARLPKGCEAENRPWHDGPDKGELFVDDKHYVVLPPSRHPSGSHYEWINEPVGLEDFPVLSPVEAGFIPAQSPAQPAANPNTKSVTTQAYHVRQAAVRVSAVPLEVQERDAVYQCLPVGPGERNACLGKLARSLRRFPDLYDADVAAVEPFVRMWYAAAEGVIKTKSWKTCWADFRAWWKTAVPADDERFRQAMAEAVVGPPPDGAELFAPGPDRALLAICQALQRYAVDGVFYLSCRLAAELCGYASHQTAADRLALLGEVGILELVEKGTGGTNRRRASRYRWHGIPS